MLTVRYVLLIAALLAAYPTYSKESSDHKTIATKKQNAENKNEQTVFDTSSLEKAIRESIKEASEKPDPQAEHKLNIDGELVKYTGQLADFTMWLVLVTGILAAVAIWQGYQLKRAVSSDRAWITPDAPTFGPVHNNTFGASRIINGYAIFAKWNNTGRSPAIKVSCVSIKRCIGFNDEIPIFDVKDTDPRTVQGIIGTGDTISGFIQWMDDNEAMAFRKQTTKILLYSRVEYLDVFDSTKLRMSESCFEICYTGGTITIEDKVQTGITWRPIGLQNRVT